MKKGRLAVALILVSTVVAALWYTVTPMPQYSTEVRTLTLTSNRLMTSRTFVFLYVPSTTTSTQYYWKTTLTTLRPTVRHYTLTSTQAIRYTATSTEISTEIVPPYVHFGPMNIAILTVPSLVVLVTILAFLRPGSTSKSSKPKLPDSLLRSNQTEVSKEHEQETPAQTAAIDQSRIPRPMPKLIPIVTVALITANLALFIVEESKGGSENMSVLIQMGAIYRTSIQNGQYFRLITAPFLHIGGAHLAANMYALFFIGMALESVYGHVRFAVVYFLSALGGSFLSALTIPTGVVAAGASGAILGCLVALIVLQSRFTHVSFGFGIGSAVLSLLYNLVSGLMPGSGVDNAAHFGGAIGGLLLSLVVSPPTEFFSQISREITPSLKESNRPEIRSAQARQTSVQQVALSGKRTKLRKPLLVATLVIIVLLGGVVFVVYPRLLISDVRLSSSPAFGATVGVSGIITIEITGHGAFALQRVTVTLEGITLRVIIGPSEQTYALPQRFNMHVIGQYVPNRPGLGSFTLETLVVAVDGLWGPVAGTPTIPVHISGQGTIQWTYGF